MTFLISPQLEYIDLTKGLVIFLSIPISGEKKGGGGHFFLFFYQQQWNISMKKVNSLQILRATMPTSQQLWTIPYFSFKDEYSIGSWLTEYQAMA